MQVPVTMEETLLLSFAAFPTVNVAHGCIFLSL